MNKKKKKSKQPLVVRILKAIAIALAAIILLGAIVARIVHYYQYHFHR